MLNKTRNVMDVWLKRAKLYDLSHHISMNFRQPLTVVKHHFIPCQTQLIHVDRVNGRRFKHYFCP